QGQVMRYWVSSGTVRAEPAPAGGAAPLDDTEWAKMKCFLARLAAGGRSAVVITSRTAEDWLGPIRRIEVGGLAHEEAAEYAGQLLAPYPAAAARRERRAVRALLGGPGGRPPGERRGLPPLSPT